MHNFYKLLAVATDDALNFLGTYSQGFKVSFESTICASKNYKDFH